MWRGLRPDVQRWILLAFCAIFGVFALAITEIGILAFTCVFDIQNDAVSLKGFAIASIIAGLVLGFQAFLGFYGTLSEYSLMLWLYYVAMAISTALIMTAIILLNKGTSNDYVKEQLRKALKKNDMEYWDRTQNTYKCCGVKSYSDWERNGLPLPESCCKKDYSAQAKREYDACKALGNGLSYIRQNNCYENIKKAISRSTSGLTIMMLIILLCEALTVTLVWRVLSHIEYEEE